MTWMLELADKNLKEIIIKVIIMHKIVKEDMLIMNEKIKKITAKK